jgi:hypothetical protein
MREESQQMFNYDLSHSYNTVSDIKRQFFPKSQNEDVGLGRMEACNLCEGKTTSVWFAYFRACLVISTG